MTGNNSSRQVLTMDMNESAASLSFGKKKGCFINQAVGVLLLLLFIGALVATGLLVYHFAPRVQEHSQSTKLPITEESSHPTTKSPEVKKDVRLPQSLIPLRYVVKLQPFINGNFSIFGHVEIEMEVIEATSNITLHIADIITKNESVKVTPANRKNDPGLEIIDHSYDNYREFYIAQLSKTLMKGEIYILSMDFVGYLNDQLRGFYRSRYKDSSGNDRWMATTQFQPTDARRAFPCFDEPSLKATFEIYLARETSMSSLSNMKRIEEESAPVKGQNGWVWDHFNTSVPMSTYLVAFVVSDFKHLSSKTQNDVDFRVWAREGAIQQAEYSLDIGPRILTFFEEYFNIPYPLPKQDMIALTDFSAGAMENWGLITYRETAMLYDPAVSSASNKQRVAIVVAHELAHQWFGNLVTPSWWTDLWLNEGFASYMEYLGTNHAEPTWQMIEQFVIVDLQYVFALDCLESSHPISITVKHPDEINEIFDRISYSKGSSIIRMMTHFLTEATFRKGVTNYLFNLSYKSAEQDNLWQYLTDAAHEDKSLLENVNVKMIMDTWTLQMGYPVINVNRSREGISATVSQERFLLVKKEKKSQDQKYRWWVPLTYTSQNNPNFEVTKPKYWLKDSETEITISSLPSNDQWVIFNLQETGYYRVNYDDNNWNLLIQQLKDDHMKLHTINRAQLIDDALNLARAGQLPYRTALDVVAYLGKEQNYIPISSALTGLNYLQKMFKRSAGFGALKEYILKLIIPLYESVGFEDKIDDPHLEQFKRVKALRWACSFGHQDCITNATTLYNQWMDNPTNTSIISPNLKSIIYCTGISAGGETEWNFAWNQYLSSNVGSEKDKLLSALGCTKKLWMLSRYIDMAFKEGTGIRKQDAHTVFRSVAGNEYGRDLAWSYLRLNWKMISDYYGSSIFTLPRIVETATSALNTEEHLHEIKLFQETHGDELGTAKRAVEQGLERTINNIAWMNTNYKNIVQWLEENGYSSNVIST